MRRTWIAGFICLSLALACANTLLSHWFENVVMGDNLMKLTQQELMAYQGPVDTLVLGDSHPKRGVRASVLDQGFNLAVPGQMYTETYYTLKSILEQGEMDVRYVIVQADISSFAEGRLDEWPFLHEYAPFVNYIEIGRNRGKLLEYTLRQALGLFAPYVGRRDFMLSYIEHGETPFASWLRNAWLEQGSLLSNDSITSKPRNWWRKQAAQRAELVFRDENPMDPLLIDYFERLIALCEENGIQLMVVNFPISQEFLDAASKFLDVNLFYVRIETLVAAHPNAHLLDMRSAFRGKWDYFRDVDHLNARGATELSRTIRDEIRRLRSEAG